MLQQSRRYRATSPVTTALLPTLIDWGKKRLAYEIQKSKEAYYYFTSLMVMQSVQVKLRDTSCIMEPVVRYLCVKQEA